MLSNAIVFRLPALCRVVAPAVSNAVFCSSLPTSSDQCWVCMPSNVEIPCLSGRDTGMSMFLTFYAFDPGLRQAPAGTRRQRLQKYAAVAASQTHLVGSLTAQNLKFAFIVARFNDLITKPLLSGALEAFERHGGDPSNADVSCVGWLAY